MSLDRRRLRPGPQIDKYCAVIMMLTTGINDDLVIVVAIDYQHSYRHMIECVVDLGQASMNKQEVDSPLNLSDGLYCAVVG
jgi:hypothetical protein